MADVRRFLVVSLLGLAACGTPPPAPSTSAAPVTTGDEATPPPLVEAPCEPAVDASVSFAALRSLEARARAEGHGPDVLAFLAEATTWSMRDLEAGRLFESLGLAPDGRARFVLCRADDDLRWRLDAIEALVPDARERPAGALDRALRDAFGDGTPAYLHARAFLPAADVARLEQHLATALQHGYEAIGAHAGRDLVFVAPQLGTVLAITRLPSGLVLEFAEPFDARVEVAPADRATDARTMLARSAPPRSFATPEEVSTSFAWHATVVPDRLAPLNFALGVGATMRALANADPEARSFLVPMGLTEAHESLDVAGPRAHSTYERLVFGMQEDGAVEVRFDVRDPSSLPPFDAAHRFALGASGEAGGVFLAPAFVRALPLDAATAEEAEAGIERAGAFAAVYAMPQALAAALRTFAARELLEQPLDALDTAAAPFADLGVVMDDDVNEGGSRVARVAAGFDPRAAACSFARAPADCARRLRVGGVLPLADGRALWLGRVAEEHVVVVASSPARARAAGARLLRVSPEDDGSRTEPVRVSVGTGFARRWNVAGFGTLACPGSRMVLTIEGGSLVGRIDRFFCAPPR